MIVYKTLKYGIKNGDISLINRVISVCCFYFEATKQSNYAFEMLYLKRLISTKACDYGAQYSRIVLSIYMGNRTPGKKWTAALST
jgi:hypothetical protein